MTTSVLSSRWAEGEVKSSAVKIFQKTFHIFRKLSKWRKSACTVNLDTANSEIGVTEDIILKCARILKHVNQQKLVKNDIQKAVRNTIPTKVVDLEVNVQTKMFINPVSASRK